MNLKTLFGSFKNLKKVFQKKAGQENDVMLASYDTLKEEHSSTQKVEKEDRTTERVGYRNVVINMNMDNCDAESESKSYRKSK